MLPFLKLSALLHPFSLVEGALLYCFCLSIRGLHADLVLYWIAFYIRTLRIGFGLEGFQNGRQDLCQFPCVGIDGIELFWGQIVGFMEQLQPVLRLLALFQREAHFIAKVISAEALYRLWTEQIPASPDSSADRVE